MPPPRTPPLEIEASPGTNPISMSLEEARRAVDEGRLSPEAPARAPGETSWKPLYALIPMRTVGAPAPALLPAARRVALPRPVRRPTTSGWALIAGYAALLALPLGVRALLHAGSGRGAPWDGREAAWTAALAGVLVLALAGVARRAMARAPAARGRARVVLAFVAGGATACAGTLALVLALLG